MQNGSTDPALPPVDRQRALIEQAISQIQDQLFIDQAQLKVEQAVASLLRTDQKPQIEALTQHVREMLVRLDAWQLMLSELEAPQRRERLDAPPSA